MPSADIMYRSSQYVKKNKIKFSIKTTENRK